MPTADPPSPISPVSQGSPQKPPGSRRAAAAAAASARLSTIVEGQARNRGSADRSLTTPPPQIPTRSPWRALAYSATSRSPWSSSNTSVQTAPPAYEWVSDPSENTVDPRAPIEGEKVAALRRGEQGQYRGGWRRLALIFGAIALIVIALAVGLGVGLTVGRKKNNNTTNDSNNPDFGYGQVPTGNGSMQFPLGEYSMITTLRTVNTDCTSNSATWRCYPYSTYNPSDITSINRSTAVFNWIISNTSSIYPSNHTAITSTTSSSGIPSNLTISSTNNPFSIIFSNQALTYHATSGNDSSPYLSFTIPTAKSVIPSAPLTSDGMTSTCYFNSTTMTARLYLKQAPGMAAMQNSTAFGGGFMPWPYAISIVQSSPSGSDIPVCYNPDNVRIANATTPVNGNAQCACVYQNF